MVGVSAKNYPRVRRLFLCVFYTNAAETLLGNAQIRGDVVVRDVLLNIRVALSEQSVPLRGSKLQLIQDPLLQAYHMALQIFALESFKLRKQPMDFIQLFGLEFYNGRIRNALYR